MVCAHTYEIMLNDGSNHDARTERYKYEMTAPQIYRLKKVFPEATVVIEK